MTWPTSQDYNEAVQDAASFADAALKRGGVAVNAMGLPVPRSGNFADVYQFTDGDGKVWALKCFTRKVPGLRERYVKIDEHLNKAKLPFTVGFKFLEQGVQVKGEWFPLLKMEWVEGFTLNEFVARNLDKPHYLHALVQMWAKLAGRLRDAHMAHADLQHGNVLLVPGATPQKLGLKLIDYDGMWVPALAEFHSGEVGHPNFQHPLRLKERQYNGEVDRFPHLVIAAALRATLLGGRGLWERFDNEDNLLFREADLKDPAASPVFKAVWQLNDPVLRALVGHLALSATQPLRKTPWLDDLLFEDGGPKLTAEQEKQVCTLLGVAPPSTAAKGPPPLPVQQEFNVFQFFDEDDTATQPAGKAGTRRTPPKTIKRTTQPAKKSKLPLLIGGGAVAAVLVIGGIVAAVSMGGKQDRPTEVVKGKDDDMPKPPDQGGGKPPKSGGNDANAPKVTLASTVNTKDDLARVLTGSKWDWGDAILELKADAVTYEKNWEEVFHLSTRWEALDRRTALLYVDSGRKLNRYAVLEFSEDLEEFTGFDFGHMTRMPPKKRVGDLPPPASGAAPSAPPAGSKDDLRQQLANSQWQWQDNGRMVLKEDGYTELPRTEGGPELLVRWEPIDRRTAMLVVENGRTVDRIALLQFAEDLHEFTGFDFSDAKRLSPHQRLDNGGGRPTPGSSAPPVGIAALPTGRDYLFIRKDDPALYLTQNGSPRRAREVGRHTTPIRALAVAADGSEAVTGSEDGEVRVWSLKDIGNVAPAGPRPGVGGPIARFQKIDTFGGELAIDVFEKRVVFRDVDNKKSVSVTVGRPGFPVKGAFARSLETQSGLKEKLGQAITNEVKLFGDDLTAQAFEGGIQIYGKTAKKSWFGWHARRKPAEESAPKSPTPAAAGRADYVWLDDALPAGAIPPTPPFQADVPWKFVEDGPIQSGKKSAKLTAKGGQQNTFVRANPGLRAGEGDVLFAYVYIDPKDPPEQIMLQWHTRSWDHRAYWGADKLSLGSPAKKSMGALPETGKWVRLEVKIDDVRINPGAVVTGLAIAQFGGTAYWDTIGINTATPQGGDQPAAPKPAGSPLKLATKVQGPQTMSGLKGEYTFTLYREGILIKDNKSGTEATVFAGAPPNEINGPFKGQIENAKSPFKEPVSDPREILGGELTVQLFRNGFLLLERSSNKTWNLAGQPVVGNPVAGAPVSPKADTAPRALKEHTGAIVACTISADGARAVSIGKDKLLCEWDLKAAKLIRKFPVPEPLGVAYMPDGKSVLLGTERESASVWDLEKQVRAKQLPGHQVPVRAVCASADRIWTGDTGGQIRIWSVPDFEYRGSLQVPNQGISALALSPDGQLVACAGSEGLVRLFDAKTNAIRANREDSTRAFGLAFINGGSDVLVARDQGPLAIHLARPGAPSSGPSKSLRLVNTAPCGDEQIWRTVYRPDGKALLLIKKNSVTVVEGDTGKEIRSWAVAATVGDAEFGPDTTVYLLLMTGKFQAWDWQTGKMLHEYDAATRNGGPRPIRLCPTGDSRRLLVLTSSPVVWVWDTENWKEVDRFTPYAREPVIASAPYPDGSRAALVLSSAGGLRLVVWDVARRREEVRLEPVEMRSLFRHEVSPNGKWIVAISNEEVPKMYIWDARDGKLRHTIPNVPRAAVSGGFTPGGDYYVACFYTGKMLTVNLAEGRVVEDYQPRIPHHRAAGAPAAGLFATADADKQVRIWRFEIDNKPAGMVPPRNTGGTNTATERGGLLKESEPLSASIVNCAFSTDGKKIYAVTGDGLVHVLDASTLAASSPLTLDKNAKFTHMSFVPKGKTASGSSTPEHLYVLDEDRKLHICDPEKKSQVKSIDLKKYMTKLETIDQFMISPTGTYLLAFDNFHRTSISWNLPRNAASVPAILQKPPFGGETNCLTYSGDGRMGAAHASRKLLVWNVQSGGEVRRIDTALLAHWVGLVPDANTVVVASRNELRGWNYTTGKQTISVTDPHGRFGSFRAAAVPKGNRLVTIGFDRRVRVWDVTTGDEVTDWSSPSRLDNVALSLDGKFAVTWNTDTNRLALWAMPGVKTGTDTLEIEAAFYGQNVSWIDATEKLRGMVKGKPEWTGVVRTEDFGEPAPGFAGPRTLLVRYKVRGQTKFDAVYEKDKITLPRAKASLSPPSNPAGKIEILAAFYGQNVSWIDVTDKLQRMVKGKDKFSAIVKTEDFGEPAPGFGAPRTLLVRYSIGGKVQLKRVYQNDTIIFP